MSYQNGQRIPAWKRLGLKLKGPASVESPAPATSTNVAAATAAPAQSPIPANAGLKRKQPPSATAPIRSAAEKRQRTEAVSSSPKKTVKFTEDTKAPEDKSTAEKPKKAPKKPKEKKKAKSKPAVEPAEPFNLEPSLAYLRQWHTDRGSWKFNKNHQTLLIKYFFDTGRIPAADVPAFLAYIRDLKGFVRTRLREEAAALRKKDMADGAAGFGQVKEKADRESKQELYEETLSKLLLRLGQEEDGASAAADGKAKRGFDEAEFAAEEMDVDVKQRAAKRMRAELVLQELSDSEEITTSAATATTPTPSAAQHAAETAESSAAVEKSTNPNDGTQPLKRRRLRKSRTAGISDDSSSESESDSESDSDSDSSSDSSDEEEDEEMPLANGDGGESSSSSSSSESESESDSDDSSDSESESATGAKVEEDGDDSSSDSDDSS